MSVAALTGLPTAPTVDRAAEPAAVRHGGAAAQRAYETGVGFEQMLMSELTQSLTATLGSTDDASSADSAGGGATGTGSAPSSPLGAYSSLLSGTLGTAVTSGSAGDAVAMQIAESIDPRLSRPGDAT